MSHLTLWRHFAIALYRSTSWNPTQALSAKYSFIKNLYIIILYFFLVNYSSCKAGGWFVVGVVVIIAAIANLYESLAFKKCILNKIIKSFSLRFQQFCWIINIKLAMEYKKEKKKNEYKYIRQNREWKNVKRTHTLYI